ncbi:MAG: DinB family protein [Pseudomonadota bacterium]
MIEPGYVQVMSRYNAWQNRQLTQIVEVMDYDALTQDRGAFFGSILATLNHLLWGDRVWMSRFSDTVPAPANLSKPGGGMPDTVSETTNVGDWSAQRFDLDGKIKAWADGLHMIDLKGDLIWYSGATGKELSKPLAMCVIHFLNHQTHHRGQVHAMLTAAGQNAPVTDIPFMPET